MRTTRFKMGNRIMVVRMIQRGEMKRGESGDFFTGEAVV